MEELDLKELFQIFWNKKIQIILIVAIFMVIGVIYSIGFVTPMYESYTTLLLVKGESEGTQQTTTSDSITTTDLTLNSKLVSTYRELIRSKDVLRQVISNLNINVNEDDIRNNITVTSVEETELIEITVQNEDPTYAAKIANEIAKVFTEKVAEIYKINNVHIIDEAEIENTPSNINHVKDVVIFTAIGLIIAVMYVLIANMLDTTITTAEDVEKLFKVPVLANIPLYNFENGKGGKK